MPDIINFAKIRVSWWYCGGHSIRYKFCSCWEIEKKGPEPINCSYWFKDNK